MNKITYTLLWPGGNTTALVTSSHPRQHYQSIALRIMEEDASIEQVGFWEEKNGKNKTPRLQMMGGEFCGNATRAAGFFWAIQTRQTMVRIETSGLEETVEVHIRSEHATVHLPPHTVQDIREVDEGWLVDLVGIRHLIIPRSLDEKESKSILLAFAHDLPAVGLITTNIRGDHITIDPLIWVRETDSLIRETGCASGSLAAAMVAHQKNNRRQYSVLQPSREKYMVDLERHNRGFSRFLLGGTVKTMHTKSIMHNPK